MTHRSLLSLTAPLLGILTLIADAAPVRAQAFGFESNFTYRGAYPVPFNFYRYQYQTLSTGSATLSRYSYTNSPVPINNGFYSNPGYYSEPGPYSTMPSSSMGGGYGSYGTNYDMSSNPLLEKQRSALRSAQANAKWNTPADTGARTNFDAWLSEQSARREANNPAVPLALDIALINPNDEQLLSGLALNDLSAKILALEAKGKKAAAGLCPPELVEKIVFTGGPPAEALNRMHAAKLDYPAILLLPEFNMLVEAFDKAYAPIFATLQTGKKVAPADIDCLLTVIEKAKPMTEPMLKDASIKHATALLAFYSSLESAAKYLKDANAVGVLGTKWQSLGVNVSDLAKHLQKYRVNFGRAAAGDEAAYGSLHRGLLAYYAALSQAK
jgi:hypothetical protein